MLITCDGERVKQQFWEVKLCEIYDRKYKDMIFRLRQWKG